MKKSLLIGLISTSFISLGQINFEEQFAASSPQIPYDIGGNSNGELAFGDIDGDGDTDIFKTGEGPVNNFYNYAAQIYLNDGTGNYKIKSLTLDRSYRYSSCELLDVDGDNDLDLIVGGAYSFGTNLATDLYINDGAGNFTISAQNFPGIRYGDIQSIDIENDGDLDLLISGSDINNTQITELYENDGSGVFTLNTASTFSTLVQVTIEAGDLNNDGMVDLIMAGAQDIEIYQNTNGVFNLVSPSPLSFETSPFPAIRITDIDNDNDNDIFVIGPYWSNGTPYMVINEGGFSFTTYQPGPFPNTAVSNGSIDVADINNDGNIDVLYSGIETSGTPTIYTDLLLGDGTGNFTSSTNIDLSEKIGAQRSTSKFVDVDSDNDLDIILSGSTIFGGIDEIQLFINDGSGIYSKIERAIEDGFWGGDSKIADFDQDGDNDLIVSGRMNGTGIENSEIKYFLNDGLGNLTETTHSFGAIGGGVLLEADIDGDTDIDILFSGWDGVSFSFSTALFKNDGGNSFTTTSQPFNALNIQEGVFMDYDNDGDIDLVASKAYGSADVLFYQNDGTGAFTLDNSNSISGDATIDYADYDGDGDLDFFLGSSVGSGLYLNDGSGLFTIASGTFSLLDNGRVKNIDIENDGDIDVIVTGADDNSGFYEAIIYENDGSGNLTQLNNSLYGYTGGDISVIDVNEDGFSDIIMCGNYSDNQTIYEKGTKVFLNSGNGTFALTQNDVILDLSDNSHFTEGDLNNDNTIDLFVSGQSSVGSILSALYLSDGCSIDPTVSVSGLTITTNQVGTTYQWIDCDNGNAAIPGEISASFTASVNGNYACIINNGICVDTTECVSIAIVNLSELNDFQVMIYPNPTENMINIEIDQEIKEVALFDVSGQLIRKEYSTSFSVKDLASGVYTLAISTSRGVTRKRFIRK